MSKQYPRLNKIELPKFSEKHDALRDALIFRRSYRSFSMKPISGEALSELLYYSSGITHVSKKDKKTLLCPYPSAGAMYPLELYPLIRYGMDIPKGLYHYNPLSHSLDVLLQTVPAKLLAPIWMSQAWFKQAAVVIFITAVFKRTTKKYGEKGLSFPFIEAGHLVQNMYLISQSLNLGCCAIGMMHEEAVIRLLDIDPIDEYPVYYVALGR